MMPGTPNKTLYHRSLGWHAPALRLPIIVVCIGSWTVVNTVYTLRYADLHFGSTADGITFSDAAGQTLPDYRDFAYVAFTIGMTYQVSDTAIRDPRIRRTVLSHALLSYVFGVVIVAGSVSLITGLVR
jgi:uncharacterized membrane protein